MRLCDVLKIPMNASIIDCDLKRKPLIKKLKIALLILRIPFRKIQTNVNANLNIPCNFVSCSHQWKLGRLNKKWVKTTKN